MLESEERVVNAPPDWHDATPDEVFVGRGPMGFRSEIVGYRIYYADGGMVESAKALHPILGQDEWSLFPSRAVQIVVLYQAETFDGGRQNYRVYLSGSDYYWRMLHGDQIVYAMGNAFTPGKPLAPAPGQVKEGLAIDDASFRAIMERATTEKVLWT